MASATVVKAEPNGMFLPDSPTFTLVLNDGEMELIREAIQYYILDPKERPILYGFETDEEEAEAQALLKKVPQWTRD